MSTFQGFPRGLFEFFTELQADNSKVFWQTNKHRYEHDVNEWTLSLAHPRRAYYNVLAAADYFRAAALADGTSPDRRMADAIEHIRAQRQLDGRWLQGHRLQGKVWFHIDAPTGEPSRWITHQAIRVLEWWDAQG